MSQHERAYRTPVIILKRRDFGEADRLLTVLTPDHGKLNVIAKGARKPISSKTGHVELFTQADMLIHRGRDLDIAAQVMMTEGYQNLREDLQRGAYANYVAELLDRFTSEGDEDTADLFDLLAQTLQRLCDDDELRLVCRFYEMRLLDIVGFRPELNECVISHDQVLPEDQYFSYSDGGVVSPQAARHTSGLVTISLPALKLLRHIQRSPYTHVQSLHITPQLHQDVERLMLGYLTHLLERRLQSVDFIRRIRST